MGFAMFQPNISKWNNWIENGKYLISYDDSDITHPSKQRTLKKALETLESVTSFKFVKYERCMNSPCWDGRCSDGDPCSWYMEFVPSKGFRIKRAMSM